MINIIFESEKLLVVEKPVGFDSEKQMVEALKSQLSIDIFPIHRLDTIVGGVMLFGKVKEVCNIDFEKEYLAVITGRMENKKGELVDYLYHDKRSNKTFVVKKERNGVKKAILDYEVISEKEEFSLVKIKLQTGRTHQIRIQFAARKHPLVGDGKYGSKDNKCKCALWSYRIKLKNKEFVLFPPECYPFNQFNIKELLENKKVTNES